MGLFGFGRTPTEVKRDDYDKLHDYLKEAVREHDKRIDEAEKFIKSYQNSVPNLSNSKIPSNHFDVKREKLTDKLKKDLSREKEKRSELVSARSKAYEKYEEYKAQVVHEELLEQRRKEREAEERKERLRKWQT
ncbi:hypothetical protein MFLO_01940 [Listeria floridensis FSL S10-1187]|uniref:Uncharacterized protein n=1 Tax=Listeria floridensis FSL S10-1187 TaxID=1265817 RepID=A0ABP3B1Z6_9LIST|nr:hypothetical protein [Listeria floridensis]EUJ33940.1 hypothetical protein MFLO_01940 [Listeria floridensis FSL S10-1187]